MRMAAQILIGSFWEAISPIVFYSQVFGIIPLKGVSTKPVKSSHFSWVSVGCFVCFVFMTWDLVVIGAHIHFDRNSRINAGIITTLLFHSMGFCIYGAFLQLARRWVQITSDWTDMEQRFLRPPYITKSSKQLKSKLVRIGLFITVLSIGNPIKEDFIGSGYINDFILGEHALFQGSAVFKFYGKGLECNITDRGISEFYIERFPYIYELMPNGWALALSQLVSIYGTAAWNFLDLFIILISIGISTRFEQLTIALKEYLDHVSKTQLSSYNFRKDFIGVCELLAYVDNHMGIVVFLSAVNNLYFVCSQLLNVFNTMHYFIEYVYYWYSLLYLIGRTLYLFISAAAINEAAESPKYLLHDIPAEDWTRESSRFLFQINSKTIALSAMGFCNITRRLILTLTYKIIKLPIFMYMQKMAGAIVTFELVMMQFNSTSGDLPSICD